RHYPDLTMRSWRHYQGNKRLSRTTCSDRSHQRRGSENHHRARYCDLDCTGSMYCRHQGRLGGHDDRSETRGWVITSASGQHWSARGRQSTALVEPGSPGMFGTGSLVETLIVWPLPVVSFNRLALAVASPGWKRARSATKRTVHSRR